MVLIDEVAYHAVSLVPKDRHWSRTLVFLHGFGDSAVWTLRELALYDRLQGAGLEAGELKLVFPFAPIRYGSRSWFDYSSQRGPSEEDDVDLSHVREERERLHGLLDHEAKLVGGASMLFVGGFSQGCQMAWDVALTWNCQAGGLIAFCGYPMRCSIIEAGRRCSLLARHRIPILGCHGEHDEVVSPDLAVEQFLPLADLGFEWEFIVDDDLAHHILHEPVLGDRLCRFLRKHWNSASVPRAGESSGPGVGASDGASADKVEEVAAGAAPPSANTAVAAGAQQPGMRR